MTQRELAQRVEHWRAILVPDWNVVLMRRPPEGVDEEDSLGAIESDATYRTARLWINPDADEFPSSRDLDETIVHELIHCVLQPLVDAYDELAGALGDYASDAARRRRVSIEEPICQALSRATLTVKKGPRARTRWNPKGL